MTCSTFGGKRAADRLLEGIVKEWVPREGPRIRWQSSIKMGRQERGRHGMDWTHLDQESCGLL